MRMPIRFKPDGSFEFDTIEEAIAWRERLAKTPVGQSGNAPQDAGRDTGNANLGGAMRSHKRTPSPAKQRDIPGYLKALSDNGRAVIGALAGAHPEWLIGD